MSLAVNVTYYLNNNSANTQTKAEAENFSDQVSDLQNQTANLNSQLLTLTQEKETLLTQLLGNVTQVQDLNNKIAKVQTQLDYFKNRILVLFPFEEQGYLAASDNGKEDISFLITRLGSSDVHNSYGGNRLFVQGTVYNIGTETARSCRLHVVLYQSGTAIRDVYIGLGTLDEYDSASVTQNIQYYSAAKLTNWTIDIEHS